MHTGIRYHAQQQDPKRQPMTHTVPHIPLHLIEESTSVWIRRRQNFDVRHAKWRWVLDGNPLNSAFGKL